MINWFNNLDVFYQVLFVLGCVSTVVMFIQLIMLIVGIEGADSSFDGIDDGGIDDIANDGGILDIFGLRVLTIRNLFIFLAMFSWVALLLNEWTNSYAISIIVGLLVAIVIVLVVSFIMKQGLKLQDEGNVKIENAIGKKGTCYLTIPSNKQGMGKVNVLVQDRLFEFDAYTDDKESIPTGCEIVVVDSLTNALIVRKVNNGE